MSSSRERLASDYDCLGCSSGADRVGFRSTVLGRATLARKSPEWGVECAVRSATRSCYALMRTQIVDEYDNALRKAPNFDNERLTHLRRSAYLK